MSVQPTTTTADLPDRVSCTILGQDVIADVVETTLEATASTFGDVLLVEVNGSRYRVDAAEADPA